VICISSGILKSLVTKSAMTRKNNRQLIKMKETEKKDHLFTGQMEKQGQRINLIAY
jgi:hypothetical protein